MFVGFMAARKPSFYPEAQKQPRYRFTWPDGKVYEGGYVNDLKECRKRAESSMGRRHLQTGSLWTRATVLRVHGKRNELCLIGVFQDVFHVSGFQCSRRAAVATPGRMAESSWASGELESSTAGLPKGDGKSRWWTLNLELVWEVVDVVGIFVVSREMKLLAGSYVAFRRSGRRGVCLDLAGCRSLVRLQNMIWSEQIKATSCNTYEIPVSNLVLGHVNAGPHPASMLLFSRILEALLRHICI